ncbi:hypothetical protein CRI94_12780 [Longibacter salinarum]|uniref:Porin n=1 Tax=Longibacter salinarum TaxID=1850348 RepID=A0A2A8CW04_9BACT|nr:hypothetical protein [Longibacter salinarum]PEN12872.1 hypothetical protein CRI94_12780 [Longibacter salinarum]
MDSLQIRTPAVGGGFAAVLVILLFFLPQSSLAQESDDGPSLNVSGFIKSSYFYDSRDVITARNEDFLLYPAPDANPDGDDASDTDNLSAFQLFSRLRLSIGNLPDALGADVTGYMEADFFGPGTVTDAVGQENIFRLRRAFANMSWDNREVKFGLEWSPLFTLGAYPHTVATEAGAPYNPFARQPMIKLTLKPGNLRLIGITSWQFDAFREADFLGVNGIDLQQQSALPGLHGHAQYVGDNGFLIGAGGYLRWLRPVATGDRVPLGAGTAYLAYSTDAMALRAKGVYGSTRDHVMPGGFIYDPGADDIENGQPQYVTDAFSQLNTASGWLEIEKKGTVAPGLFIGYLKALGSSDDITNFGSVGTTNIIGATRSPNLESVFDISPRLAFNYGALRLALEAQFTSATYAASLDENYAPNGDTDSVLNVRGNFTVFLFF